MGDLRIPPTQTERFYQRKLAIKRMAVLVSLGVLLILTLFTVLMAQAEDLNARADYLGQAIVLCGT